MSNDIGQYPPDSGDTAPASPLAALSNLNTTATRRRKPKYLKRYDDFNPESDVQQQIHKGRDNWSGIILNVDEPLIEDDKYKYEIELQNGQTVTAYYPGQTVADYWEDFQTVTVFFNGIDYIITSIPRSKRVNLWWQAKDALLPGGSALGTILHYDDDTEEFKDDGGTVTLEDAEYRNCVLIGERVQVQINETTYEPIGSYGLFRKCKPNTTINPSGSGVVTVYKDSTNIAKKLNDDNQEVDLTVTAYLNWGHGNKPVLSNKEMFITYLTNEKKWLITGGEC